MAEEHILTPDPENVFEQTTSGESVTRKHLIVEGGSSREKEANSLSPHAGASSEAPASSGIPSAVTQHGLREAAAPETVETPMAGHILPTKQNLEP